MLKSLFLLALGLLAFRDVSAQNRKDTVIFFMKEPEWIVDTKSQADFIRYVLPPDSSSGIKLYPVHEYYPNGKQKLVGATTSTSKQLHLEGGVTEFYTSGERMCYAVYHNSWIEGDIVNYYPNGKLYTISGFDKKLSKHVFKECRDPTGTVLAQNETGTWIQFNGDFTKIVQQGPIKNELQNGKWEELSDTLKHIIVYSKGEVKSGITYDNAGKAYPFKETSTEPQYKTGKEGLEDFLSRNTRFPDYDKKTIGRAVVYVSFVVEKDGALTNVAVTRGVSEGFNKEALRVIKSTAPWLPATSYGIPYAQVVSIPVNFFPKVQFSLSPMEQAKKVSIH